MADMWFMGSTFIAKHSGTVGQKQINIDIQEVHDSYCRIKELSEWYKASPGLMEMHKKLGSKVV